MAGANPLIHEGSGWRFDTGAGETEILDRRIGRNELSVIEVCRAYVEAQRDFADAHPLPDGKKEFAQKFFSSEGKHDGLYWETKDGEEESPLGPLIAKASEEGYPDKAGLDQREPYHGYFYKILFTQGEHTADGVENYIAADGHMVNGFALVAFPAKYGDSGVMTFIVNDNGIVYQKNLGSVTPDIATAMTSYDPDDGWHIIQ